MFLCTELLCWRNLVINDSKVKVEARKIEVFWLSSQQLPHLEFQPLRRQQNVCRPVVNRFTRQTIPAVNIYLKVFFALSPFPHKKKTRNRRVLFYRYSSRTVAILTTETSHWTCACSSATAGLCCYLVIHIENLLHSSQLFYSHLWRSHWLSLLHGYQGFGVTCCLHLQGKSDINTG
jgi:hypothetical protein